MALALPHALQDFPKNLTVGLRDRIRAVEASSGDADNIREALCRSPLGRGLQDYAVATRVKVPQLVSRKYFKLRITLSVRK